MRERLVGGVKLFLPDNVVLPIRSIEPEARASLFPRPIEGGSRLRLVKIAAPSPSPPANDLELYYDTTGLGTPASACLVAMDESGNKYRVAGVGTTLDYRLIGVRALIVGSTSYVPTAGTRAIYVEMVGGGAQGGGAATSSATASCGGGGGGGAYAASFLAGASVKNPTAYAIGAGGSTTSTGAVGQVGGDTSWDTSVIVAKGGSGGPALVAGTTVVTQVGGIGGLASASTGDSKVNGGNGHSGIRASAALAWGGDGGGSFFAPGAGGGGVGSVTGGVVGTAATAGQYGAGGGGAATLTTQQPGGAGIGGAIRIWEMG